MRPEYWIVLGCCELFALIVNTEALRILVKRDRQRTSGERRRLQNGLGRAVALELLVMVPATATLTWMLAPIIPFGVSAKLGDAYAPLLGIVSYGFPFRAVRMIVQQLALNTIKSFAAIAARGVAEDVGKSDGDIAGHDESDVASRVVESAVKPPKGFSR